MANVIPDPSFNVGVSNWRSTRGGVTVNLPSWDQVTYRTPPGAGRLTRVHATDTGTMNMITVTKFPTEPLRPWYGSAWVFNASPTPRPIRTVIVWQNAGGTDNFIEGTAPPQLLSTWYRVQVAGLLPATAVTLQLAIEGRTGWTQNQYWVADDTVLEGSRSIVASEDGLHIALVDIQAWPEENFERSNAVLPIQGRQEPIVLLDTLRLPSSEITFLTRTTDEATALLDVLAQPGRLHLMGTCPGIQDIWFAPLSTRRQRLSTTKASDERRLWATNIQQVVGPAVITPLARAKEDL